MKNLGGGSKIKRVQVVRPPEDEKNSKSGQISPHSQSQKQAQTSQLQSVPKTSDQQSQLQNQPSQQPQNQSSQLQLEHSKQNQSNFFRPREPTMKIQVISVMGDVLFEAPFSKVLECKKGILNNGDMTIVLRNDESALTDYYYQNDISIVHTTDYKKQDSNYLFVKGANQQNLESFMEQVVKLRPEIKSNLPQQKDLIKLRQQQEQQQQEKQKSLNRALNFFQKNPAWKNVEILKRKTVDNSLTVTRLMDSDDGTGAPKLFRQYNLFEKINMDIMLLILQFLGRGDRIKMRLLNKWFDSIYWLQVRELNFNKFCHLDFVQINSIIKKSRHVLALKLQYLKNLSLQQVKQIEWTQAKLVTLDFSNYNNLTDVTLNFFLTRFRNLKSLSLPYISKLTNNLFKDILRFSPNLEKFDLYSTQDLQKNDLILDNTLADYLQKQKNLRYLALTITEKPVLEVILANSFLQQELRTLRLKTIILKPADLSCLVELKSLQKLRDLKIKNLFYRSGKIFKQHTQLEPDSPILGTFSQLNDLRSLHFGAFLTNQILQQLAKANLTKLEIIKFKSMEIRDEFLIQILISTSNLRRISLNGSQKISPPAFEIVSSKKLEYLKIRYDDFSLEQLQQYLRLQGLKPKVVNVVQK